MSEVKKFCPNCLNATFEFVHHKEQESDEYECRCAVCHKHINNNIFDSGFGTDQWEWEDENGNVVVDHFV